MSDKISNTFYPITPFIDNLYFSLKYRNRTGQMFNIFNLLSIVVSTIIFIPMISLFLFKKETPDETKEVKDIKKTIQNLLISLIVLSIIRILVFVFITKDDKDFTQGRIFEIFLMVVCFSLYISILSLLIENGEKFGDSGYLNNSMAKDFLGIFGLIVYIIQMIGVGFLAFNGKDYVLGKKAADLGKNCKGIEDSFEDAIDKEGKLMELINAAATKPECYNSFMRNEYGKKLNLLAPQGRPAPPGQN